MSSDERSGGLRTSVDVDRSRSWIQCDLDGSDEEGEHAEGGLSSRRGVVFDPQTLQANVDTSTSPVKTQQSHPAEPVSPSKLSKVYDGSIVAAGSPTRVLQPRRPPVPQSARGGAMPPRSLHLRKASQQTAAQLRSPEKAASAQAAVVASSSSGLQPSPVVPKAVSELSSTGSQFWAGISRMIETKVDAQWLEFRNMILNVKPKAVKVRNQGHHYWNAPAEPRQQHRPTQQPQPRAMLPSPSPGLALSGLALPGYASSSSGDGSRGTVCERDIKAFRQRMYMPRYSKPRVRPQSPANRHQLAILHIQTGGFAQAAADLLRNGQVLLANNTAAAEDESVADGATPSHDVTTVRLRHS